MTEEILRAAIIQLQANATERFGIIKDLYHRPATTETVGQITQHALALGQLEQGKLVLEKYADELSKQTEEEHISNTPEQPTAVEAEEVPDTISHNELLARSTSYRNNEKNRSGGNGES